VRLVDLDPRWLASNVFIFRCPHCVARGGDGEYDKYWLSCKSTAMSIHDQIVLFEQHKDLIDGKGAFIVVPCKPEHCWSVNGGDFASMSVTPSLDASASGHWHGVITNGETN